MPCDGIAVLTATLEQAQQADLIEQALGAAVKARLLDRSGTLLLQVALPLPPGGTMPVKIAVKRSGRITAITTSGTFEVGRDVLLAWLTQLRAGGIKTAGVRVETHRHDHHAPQLAYTAQQQR